MAIGLGMYNIVRLGKRYSMTEYARKIHLHAINNFIMNR